MSVESIVRIQIINEAPAGTDFNDPSSYVDEVLDNMRREDFLRRLSEAIEERLNGR